MFIIFQNMKMALFYSMTGADLNFDFGIYLCPIPSNRCDQRSLDLIINTDDMSPLIRSVRDTRAGHSDQI